MPDMLNTAISGLLTFQRALSTVSHNIANVNTEGYSRQSVEIQTNSPTFIGNTFYGSGVHVDSVNRAYDQFLTLEVRDTLSNFSRLDKFGELAARIDDVLADPEYADKIMNIMQSERFRKTLALLPSNQNQPLTGGNRNA